MDHQASIGEKLPPSPERIWLAPACNVEERSWCEDDIGCCDECGEPTIEYRRADLIEAELARLRAEVERRGKALEKVSAWLDKLAANSDKQAQDNRFPSLADACKADAKNYRATAASLRAALAPDGKGNGE